MDGLLAVGWKSGTHSQHVHHMQDMLQCVVLVERAISIFADIVGR